MKIFKLLLILLLFISVSFKGIAKSSVELNFPGAENKNVTIWTYKDLISMERIVLAETVVDKNGNFSFDVYNSTVQKCFVEIKYFRISFYVVPNEKYKIQFDKVDFNNREFYPKTVVGYLVPNYRIVKPAQAEINYELDSLNILFDNFIAENHLRLRMGNKSWRLIDTLEAEVNLYISKHPKPFLKSNADIQLAQFRMLSNQYGRDYIVKTYFDPKKIAYSNNAYMSFFKSFWINYISSSLKHKLTIQLDSVINYEKSYQALSALLANDSLLTNPSLRELVILRNLPQLYNMDKYDKAAIINILYDISASKYSKEHQRIAVNIRVMLESLKANAKAANFEFIDSNSDTINLEKLADKYIYIQLWTNECIECLSDMKYTKELEEKFDDVVTFVHISLDRNNEDMMSYIRDKDYKWHFVFLEDNYSFIQNYQVGIMPRAILIGKEGEIVNWNAPRPSEYFEDYFLKYLNDKKGNLQLENPRYRGYRKKN